jgi:hypothetical protein
MSELNDASPGDEITMSITSMDFKVASLAKLPPRPAMMDHFGYIRIDLAHSMIEGLPPKICSRHVGGDWPPDDGRGAGADDKCGYAESGPHPDVGDFTPRLG